MPKQQGLTRVQPPIFVESIDEVPGVLAGILRPDDVVITQGAGDVGRLAQLLIDELDGEAGA